MVSDRKRRSLQLYLLLLSVWPWLEKQQRPLPAAVWARALSTGKGRQWTPTNVSSAWTDLEGRGLVKRRRLARGVVVEPRREDGRADYTKPGRKRADHLETYFVVPVEFWREEWFERLTMPGVAMLLIIAGETSDKEEVWLTNEGAGRWYGLSPRSVEAGIEDLRSHGLLAERQEWIKAPLSPVGSTKRHWYSLLGAFSTDSRRVLRETAKRELETRTSTRTASGRRKPGKGASSPATGSKKDQEADQEEASDAVTAEPTARLQAWVDESVHVDVRPGFYVLAAVVVASGDHAAVRDRLIPLVRTPRVRLHWRDEEDTDRAKITEMIAGLDQVNVVVVGSPVDPARQERARRKCMECLFHELSSRGVTRVYLEQRTPSLNRRDMKMIAAMRGARTIPTSFRVEFGRPLEEPLLWIPDATAGAVAAAAKGNPRYRDSLSRVLELTEIRV